MSRKYNYLLGLLGLLSPFLFLTSCGESEQTCIALPENPKVEDMKFIRLEKELFSARTLDEVNSLVNNNPVFSRFFLDGDQYPAGVLNGKLFGISKDESIDTLYKETLETFGELGELNEELASAYSWLSHYYPSSKIPVVKTAVTGMYNDIYVSDSLLIVGLDYFIGEKATFKPINTPLYILKRYEKESIVPVIFGFVSSNYMAIDSKDNTLLADMINYGRSYYFTKQMMPCKKDGLIVGYDDAEMSVVSANQESIWAHFINRQLFYETNHFVKNKYTGERPNVFEIGDQCPGRIARWLGWQIVKAYMDKNPNVSLSQLMVETDAQKILNGSKFKAKNQ